MIFNSYFENEIEFVCLTFNFLNIHLSKHFQIRVLA